jgi:hypothetical protein
MKAHLLLEWRPDFPNAKQMTDDRRLIEDYLPIQAISAEASRQKSAQGAHFRATSVVGGGNIVLTTNKWFKAQQLDDHYWLCVVWDPLDQSPELVSIQNPALKLDHAQRGIIASRYYEIPADSIR